MRFTRVKRELTRLLFGSFAVWLAAWSLPQAAQPEARRWVSLRWLMDLGAESLVASPRRSAADGRQVLVSVPGAAYVFFIGSDGSLQKRMRLAADPAAPYGVAATEGAVALADKQGSVGLWTAAAEAGFSSSLRWRQDLGERVTSVGWDGGGHVLVATWKGRLVALAAVDGRSLWSADIGGRAEAPAVADGSDVFVATKAKSLLRLDAASGAVRWKVTLPGLALHPPVPFGQKPRLVLCGTLDGQLLAYEALSGRVRWSAALPEKLAGAPIAAAEFVAAVTADGAAHAYDPTGKLLWTAPGSAEGPATLLRQVPSGAAPRLVSVSKIVVGLDPATGARLAEYPRGAEEELRRRFADAMLDGVKTFSEAEKRAHLEQEAFEISGPLFGPARIFGPHVAFGTDDGWAHLFDEVTLRPLARYRAGQPCSGLPREAGGRILAVAGEEVFALEPLTGKTLWKRILGADPGPVAGDVLLGVAAGGRVQAIGAADGVLQWSLRGRFRSVAPPAPRPLGEESTGTPWLVDDGEGNLRALRPPGRLVGDPVPAGGDLLPVRAASARSWVAATREGKLFGVAWEEASVGGPGSGPADGGLVKEWETAFDERILGFHLAAGRVLVRSEAGSLASLDAASRQEGWRMRLLMEDRIQVLAEAGALLVLGATELRVHDLSSGEVKFQRSVPSPAVGADLRGRSLRWLDRSGAAHRLDIEGGDPGEVTDLGLALAEAVPIHGGFLVTTAAGEVGLVDVADGDPGSVGLKLSEKSEKEDDQ